ncbi:AI-2E family transporter [Bacillus solitudinis]|uniref:AI-2E family transporter n=1 Tax=Bacillus solitudinis TaxID=2014074 RepID=UPI000C238955|nr:AI-2E family transporter [Bacillus solitudinis]
MEKDLQHKWLIRLILILLILLIGFMLLQLSPLFLPFFQVVKALLIPIGIAALFSYLLHPLVEELHHRNMPRPLAILFIFIGIMALFTFGAMIGVPVLIAQIQRAMVDFPEQIKGLEQMAVQAEEQIKSLPYPIQEHFQGWSKQIEMHSVNALDQLERIMVILLQSMLAFIVIPFLIFFFLKDFELIERSAWYLTPRSWRRPLKLYIKDVDVTFGRYIRGQLLVALSVGVISITGLWLLNVPYPIILGLFIAATDLIPYFGPFIGAVPAVIVAFLDSWQLGLLTMALIFVIQQVEGNVLSPLIVGKTLHLHPMLIILALLAGVEVGGVLGLLLAVPILAILKVTLLHLRFHLMKH